MLLLPWRSTLSARRGAARHCDGTKVDMGQTWGHNEEGGGPVVKHVAL